MNVELQPGFPDPVWQRAVQLARALCTNAHLYGGHACLSCQSAARKLLTRFGEDGLGRAPGDGGRASVEPPPHGTSSKSSQSHWRQALARIETEA